VLPRPRSTRIHPRPGKLTPITGTVPI